MIAVTGGMGYIGSHTVVALMEEGQEVLILDDLSNAYPQVLDEIEKLCGRRPLFTKIDLKDAEALRQLCRQYPVRAFIHFAAFKAVGESVERPLMYYRNNLVSLLNVLEVMEEFDIRDLIFSSSCTVYGEPDSLPVTEAHPIKSAESPYGNTKQIGEEIIGDVIRAGHSAIRATLLRYFNPIGAHPSAAIGEIPQGVPNNLMPYITQTAAGIRERLSVFGDDYPTTDGTAVRDYIHVVDLAEAHVAALRHQRQRPPGSLEVFNVGTGRGYSVMEMIRAFEESNSLKLPWTIAPRRQGDVVAIYADPSKIHREIGWKARFSLEDMARTAWQWEKRFRSELRWDSDS